MSIDKKQLEINVNTHAMQPDFLNSELHYIIASDDSSFRFVDWNEEPNAGEEKFYCFLSEQELNIPAADITLMESYVLKDDPIYPVATNVDHIVTAMQTLTEKGVTKCIRKFNDDDIDAIKYGLEQKYGPVEKYLVKSSQGQHLLLLVNDVEISIAAAMVYFRHKPPFADIHYQHVKEDE